MLYGAHAFWLHPWFVARAWWKLFGFPCDPRLWVAFFVHDLGYWGCPNMDGDEGERHPEWGAQRMFCWFDGDWKAVGSELMHETKRGGIAPRYGGTRFLPHPKLWHLKMARRLNRMFGHKGDMYWHDLSLYHSRFYAKADKKQPSRLCIADKFSIALTPTRLYLPMVIATGEIREYVKLASDRRPDERSGLSGTEKAIARRTGLARPKLYWRWHRELQTYMREWVEEHRDGREDTWTPEARQARDEAGVWE